MAAARSERRLALLWLAVCGLGLAVLGLWGVVGGGAERAALALEGRLQERLDEAERLFAAGRFDAAAERLERLDRDHPAVFVKHRLDRQRERVLELLARSLTALGKKGRALEAARRAAAFDPRHWRNHRLEAEVALAFADGAAADDALARVLELYPSHLASAADRIRLAFEGGRYAEVPPLFEAYLDAWRPAILALEVGGRSAVLELRVDGRAHDLDVRLGPSENGAGFAAAAQDVPPAADPAPGRARLATAGYAVRVERLELAGAPEVGEPGPPPRAALAPPAEPWSPADRAARLDLGPAPAFEPARARLALTAFKALPPELWAMVEKSYENTLDDRGLATVRARVLVGAPDAPLQYAD